MHDWRKRDCLSAVSAVGTEKWEIACQYLKRVEASIETTGRRSGKGVCGSKNDVTLFNQYIFTR